MSAGLNGSSSARAPGAATARAAGHALLRSALDEAMAADPSVVVVGESVGRAGGSAGTTAGLLERFGPERVIEVPVADRAAVGFAAGLALGGKRVVVELTSTSRLPAVLEVLVELAAIAAASEFPCTLVVRVPYGEEAPGLDRVVGDVLGGLQVACGSDGGKAAGLLRTALAGPLAGRGPVVLLEPRAMFGERSSDHGQVPLRAVTLREGDHVTLAAWGAGVGAALAAADELAGHGIGAEVIDLVALSPIDRERVGASVRKTGRLVVVHPNDAALADHVRRVALDEAFLHLESPLGLARASAGDIARAARDAISY